MRYYRVNCYLPPREGKTYGNHMLLGIAAVGVEAALQEAKAIYPQARIDGINDQGKIHNLSADKLVRGEYLAAAPKPE